MKSIEDQTFRKVLPNTAMLNHIFIYLFPELSFSFNFHDASAYYLWTLYWQTVEKSNSWINKFVKKRVNPFYNQRTSILLSVVYTATWLDDVQQPLSSLTILSVPYNMANIYFNLVFILLLYVLEILSLDLKNGKSNYLRMFFRC